MFSSLLILVDISRRAVWRAIRWCAFGLVVLAIPVVILSTFDSNVVLDTAGLIAVVWVGCLAAGPFEAQLARGRRSEPYLSLFTAAAGTFGLIWAATSTLVVGVLSGWENQMVPLVISSIAGLLISLFPSRLHRLG